MVRPLAATLPVRSLAEPHGGLSFCDGLLAIGGRRLDVRPKPPVRTCHDEVEDRELTRLEMRRQQEPVLEEVQYQRRQRCLRRTVWRLRHDRVEIRIDPAWSTDHLVVRLLQRRSKEPSDRQLTELESRKRRKEPAKSAGVGDRFDRHHLEPGVRVHWRS
jgi:hypothetical protein